MLVPDIQIRCFNGFRLNYLLYPRLTKFIEFNTKGLNI